jgi:hypothetical protein
MRFLPYYTLTIALFFSILSVESQDGQVPSKGHLNTNKFRQLYNEFSTPNAYRAASGAPGHAYYQQRADYAMDIVLDDKNAKLSGFEAITYTNNSPDVLKYLWVQLDQNVRAKTSKTPLIGTEAVEPVMFPKDFITKYLKEPFDGGFHIESVTQAKGGNLE